MRRHKIKRNFQLKGQSGFSLIELPVVRKGEEAFSLIELLSAIAVLMIIMVIMSMIFIESDRSWGIGTGRAENNSWGRAALNMIAHDLQYAVAYSNKVRDQDLIISFALREDTKTKASGVVDKINPTSYGFTNSELCFVSLQHDSSVTPRSCLDMYYFVKPMKDQNMDFNGRYNLSRSLYINSDHYTGADANHSYLSPDWYNKKDAGNNDRPRAGGLSDDRGTLVENVAGFRCFARTKSGEVVSQYYSTNHNHELPEYVDIMLDLLNDDDAKKAAQIPSPADQQEFVEKKMRRYTTRVYFHNKYGYRSR